MDEQRFIDEIFADPDSDGPQMVYADWLEENGQSDRAELIRGQVEQRQPFLEDARRFELYQRHQELVPRCQDLLDVPQALRKKVTFDLAGGLASATIITNAKLTKADLRELARIPYLKTLQGIEHLKPALLEQLALCPNIQSVSTTDGPLLTPNQWDALKTQTHIERLRLSDYPDRVTNADAEQISAMRQLKEVELGYSEVNDIGIVHLAALSELEVLNIANTSVTDAGLEFLPSLRKLRVLNLADTHITRATLERLSALRELTNLNIGNTRIEGDPVPALLSFPKLHTVGLSRLEVSDASLPQLAKLPALRVLDLGRTKVTRFNLALMVSQTKWKKVRLEKSLDGYSDDGEDAAVRAFCRQQDVLVDVDYE